MFFVVFSNFTSSHPTLQPPTSPGPRDVWHVVRRLEVDLIHYDSAAHKGNCIARYNVAPQSGSPYLNEGDRWPVTRWALGFKKNTTNKNRGGGQVLVGCNLKMFCLEKNEVLGMRKHMILCGLVWLFDKIWSQGEFCWKFCATFESEVSVELTMVHQGVKIRHIRLWSNDLNLGMCNIATIPSDPWLFTKFTPKKWWHHSKAWMNFILTTWRAIPVSNLLISPIYKPWNGHLEGKQPYLGDLLTMVINHLLHGMILQVVMLFPSNAWHQWFHDLLSRN